uniref:Uncharacterized protein n=1 Tax=Athene cunicularia TaxID=194338 RepID=A0A663M9L6_ATHCN
MFSDFSNSRKLLKKIRFHCSEGKVINPHCKIKNISVFCDTLGNCQIIGEVNKKWKESFCGNLCRNCSARTHRAVCQDSPYCCFCSTPRK